MTGRFPACFCPAPVLDPPRCADRMYRLARGEAISVSFPGIIRFTATTPMADVLAELDQVKTQADADLAAATSNDALEQFRIKWLGANGVVKAKMSLIGQ